MSATKRMPSIIGGGKRMQWCAFLLLAAANLIGEPRATSAGLHSSRSVHEAAESRRHAVRDLQEARSLQPQPPSLPPPPGKRAVFYSELRLRSAVQTANYDLRQLKRAFMQQMTDIYLALKMDPTIGYRLAQQTDSEVASANILVAAEFADIAIKKFTVERRLLAGLKLAFVKFMPMDTLVRLYKRYRSYQWLRYQSQVDLRRRLSAPTKDERLEQLYGFIEARARVRAADDVIALTADNMQRILQTFQWLLVESKHSQAVAGPELAALAQQADRVLGFYLEHVVEWAAALRKEYMRAKRLVRPLYDQFGGKRGLLKFVDQVINVEALDIDLSKQASKLDLPPTISKQMVANLVEKWIPGFVLKSLEEDRRLLMDKRKLVAHLVRLQPEKRHANLAEWAANVLGYVCRNQVVSY